MVKEMTLEESKMEKTLNFAGAFTIGERKTEAHQRTIDEVLQHDGDLAMLVNDIDFGKKLAFYSSFGFDFVLRQYNQRRVKKCGSTQDTCTIYPADELPRIVDEGLYKTVADTLKKKGFGIKPTNEGYQTILREEIVPDLISRRISDYGLDSNQIQVYSERALRNLVAYRMHKMRNKDWPNILKQIGMENAVRNKNTPVCSGILLALYEKVALVGYTRIREFYHENDRVAIENIHGIYAKLQQAFPEDKRWQMKIEDARYYK